jgi:thioredoxin reductase (NADPH)
MGMENVIIIGSGPAGLTAAIYTARGQLNPLVIEGLQPGGQLTTTTEIENWPGFVDGIDGPVLMETMKKQAARFGTRFLSAQVQTADLTTTPITLQVNGETLETRSLIIATGATPRLLGLEAEKALMGRGVSVCATCDGFFFKGKHVLVVGGGDTAIEEALYLSGLAASVTVIHRRDELRAEKIMQQRAFERDNISFMWDSVIEDILDVEQKTVTGALIKNVKTGQVARHDCDGIFMALGHVPNTDLFSGQLPSDPQGFITTLEGTATAVPGVFAAGDVADPLYKQAVTAAGTGCMAALDVERYLQGL